MSSSELSIPAVPSETWRMLAVGAAAPARLPSGLDAVWHAATGRLLALQPRTRRYLAEVKRVIALEKRYTELSTDRFLDAIEDRRVVFRRGRHRRRDLIDACALVREAADRALGLRPHPVQVAAALILDDGCIAEMATGEGKTLAASLPAVIAGWRGRGCHLLTSNDYLATRDAETMRPVYELCGLRVASIHAEATPDERRLAYHADVTYCTNQDVAADHLRDRLLLGRGTRLGAALMSGIVDGRQAGTEQLLMRGLEAVIIDEADSILIDDAVTPLIISGEAPNREQVDAFETAASLAARLEAGTDYAIDERYREVRLTRRGRETIAQRTDGLGGIWTGRRRREELVVQALVARELFLRDREYVVDDGRVVIVDQSTGRLMPDRTWRAGLHQAVEAKEELEVSSPKDTLARISFQRFFRQYRRLAGMTGTAWEARHELWQVYGLRTVVLPTHRRCLREQRPDRIARTDEGRWSGVMREIESVHATGRPILIGTNSVDESERLGRRLTAAGLDHQVLNAVRHAEEAAIVARAGERGRITVATNMAGRGTDIKLGEGVRELGGLHVIATSRHESPRVDRQLFGRAGRQGDPGSAIAFVSLDDALLQRHGSGLVSRTARRCAPPSVAGRLLAIAQNRARRVAVKQRRAVQQTDDWLDRFLGFA